MEEMALTDPVTLLREIEESCRVCNSADPQRTVEIFSEWSGIAFRAGNNSLLASLDEVVEILEMPRLTCVPHAQPWVRGIANIRGNLLPVVDFSGFFSGKETRASEKARVIVIDYNGIYSGLMVDEVYGLKHFMENEHTDSLPEVESCFLPYVKNSYLRHGKVWYEFSLLALAETPRFLLAAA